jgi:hypothetical protein
MRHCRAHRDYCMKLPWGRNGCAYCRGLAEEEQLSSIGGRPHSTTQHDRADIAPYCRLQPTPPATTRCQANSITKGDGLEAVLKLRPLRYGAGCTRLCGGSLGTGGAKTTIPAQFDYGNHPFVSSSTPTPSPLPRSALPYVAVYVIDLQPMESPIGIQPKPWIWETDVGHIEVVDGVPRPGG